MKNLLVGNGVNIQFDKENYTAQAIVLRILKNFNREDFPSHIILNFPYMLQNYLGQLFLEARNIVKGKYDSVAFGTAERNSLTAFKEHYSNRITTLRMTDIGFEDYYLIHDLTCHMHHMQNPEQFYIREATIMAYLYAIFNDGALNQLYQKYSEQFVTFLSTFDNIFTTNYDSNIESATGKEVWHLHGQFDKKSDVYLASSFRNQLPDAPIRDIEIDEDYFYLYSNALSTHCGEYKEFQIKSRSQANQCVEKMAAAYLTDLALKEEVDNWTKNENKLTANLGCAIQLKVKNPNIMFSDDYHFREFQEMSGSLEILGLSPWNDRHIFEAIDESKLEDCVYYFFDEGDCAFVCNCLPKISYYGKLHFKSAQEFWESYSETKVRP